MDQLDPRLRPLRHHDFHDVKAKENIGIVQHAQPRERPAREPLPFFAIDGFDRPAEILTRPRLHLDEDKRVAITADEVDLATTPAAEIAIKHFVAVLPPKISSRELLAGGAALQMFRSSPEMVAPARCERREGVSNAGVHSSRIEKKLSAVALSPREFGAGSLLTKGAAFGGWQKGFRPGEQWLKSTLPSTHADEAAMGESFPLKTANAATRRNLPDNFWQMLYIATVSPRCT